MKGPIPKNETERLEALRRLEILDTGSEKQYDEIAWLAAHFCGTPYATVSFIDSDRQWFKAHYGFDQLQSARGDSFCAHTILGESMLVVPDASQDPRFADNPLVTGDQGIRFYAGVPLVTEDGLAVGAFCVLDREPRTLTQEQAAGLLALSHSIMSLLTLRSNVRAQQEAFVEMVKAESETNETAQRVNSLLNALPSILIGIDPLGNISSFNPAAEAIFEIPADQAIGRTLVSIGLHDYGQVLRTAMIDCAMERQKVAIDDVLITTQSGERRLLGLTMIPLLSGESEINGVLVTGADITNRRRLEIERRQMADHNRLLLECSGEGIIGLDLEGRCTFINQTAASILRYTKDGLIGQNIHAAIHHTRGDGSTNPSSACPCTNGMKQGSCINVEHDLFWRNDGTAIPVTYSCSPIMQDGAATGAVMTFSDISSRVKAETDLRDSREQLKLSIAASQSGLWERNYVQDAVYVSSKFATILGYDKDELGTGPTLLQSLMHPDEHHDTMARIQAYLDREAPAFQMELRLRHKDGSYRWVDAGALGVWDDAGKPIKLIGSMIDITERKTAKQALERNLSILKAQQEAAIDGILVVSEDRHIVSFNERFCEMWLVEPNYVRSHDNNRLFLQHVKPQIKDPDEFLRSTEAIYAERGRSSSDELRSVYGEVFERHSAPIISENGDYQGRVWYFRNITARKNAENALRESEERLHALVSSSPLAVYSIDLDSKVLTWNTAAERLFGWTADEIVGRRLPNVPDDRLDEHILIRNSVGSGQTFTDIETVRFGKNREPIDVSLSVSPLRDSIDRVSGIIAMAVDITARKQAQTLVQQYAHDMENAAAELELSNRDLAEARDAALAAAKLKSEFLANMSHEIRTPMNGVLGMLNLLLDTPLSTDQSKYANTIRQSADTLLLIINDILDFSKIEAGKMSLQTASFNLIDLIEEIGSLLAPQAAEKGIRILCDLPAIAAASQIGDVVGDPIRVRQVLTNLLGNAIKFTPNAGEIVVHAETLYESNDAADWRISVKDNGIGIPRDRQAMIFDSFTQADGSTTRKFGGTGLGLTICRQLIALMDGKIGVESEPGSGSTFWFELNLAKAAPSCKPGQTMHGSSPGTILVADTWDLQRTVICRYLRSRGWKIVDESKTNTETDISSIDAIIVSSDHPNAAGIMGAVCSGRTAVSRPRLVVVAPTTYRPGEDFVQATVLHQPIHLRHLLEAVHDNSAHRSKLVPSHSSTESRRAPAGVILVAEDNPVNQMVTTCTLSRMGFSDTDIEVVCDGLAAVNRWRAGGVALILMDVSMPEMDGIEATCAIRAAEEELGSARRTPIIALTAHAMPEDRDVCADAGFDGYLSKPVSAAEFAQTVDRYAPDVQIVPVSDAPEPGPNISADTLIDEELLSSVTGGDPDLARKVLAEFLKSGRNMFSRLTMMLEIGDATGVEHWAHALKGSCWTIGARSVGDQFLQIEMLAKGEDLDAVRLPKVAAELALAVLYKELADRLDESSDCNEMREAA